jgi:type I restriction enzyme, R subunit
MAGSAVTYPYDTTSGLHPRYYQDVAVRRALTAIEDGKTRLLLALATGTGKTYIASQIAWKLYRTNRAKRVLFLTDRIFLRDQAFNNFSFFASKGGDPRFAIEGEFKPYNDLYFGMYQSLYAMRDSGPMYGQIPSHFFDLVIIDECHRSGFGTWREILDHFAAAVHLGLTATPKRTDNIDTYAYFGDPVYSYSLGEGIRDGFLATYKVHRVNTSLNKAGAVDVDDAVIAGADLYVPEGVQTVKDFYTVAEFEKSIVPPDWTKRICEHLSSLLDSTDPMNRTLIFCVNMDHATAVRQELQNHFAHLGYPDYAVRIVSEEAYSGSLLEQFRDPYRQTPVVATTVDLLSTGVDIPVLRNIVFIKPIGSVVLFKQIIGRASRVDPITDKKWFRIVDYTGATRLFDDWDRPIAVEKELPSQPWEGSLRLEALDSEGAQQVPGQWAIAVAAPNDQVQLLPRDNELFATGLPEIPIPVHVSAPGYKTRVVRLTPEPEATCQLSVVELHRVVDAETRIRLTGIEVEIADEVILTVDATGQQMTVDQYLDYARAELAERVLSFADLRTTWISEEDRQDFVGSLEDRGLHLHLLGELEGVGDADGHDVITHLRFDRPLIGIGDRVKAFLNHNGLWLAGLPDDQRAIVAELLEAYTAGGIDQLRRPVLKLERFDRFGGPTGVVKTLGGSAALDRLLLDIRDKLYPQEEEVAA